MKFKIEVEDLDKFDLNNRKRTFDQLGKDLNKPSNLLYAKHNMSMDDVEDMSGIRNYNSRIHNVLLPVFLQWGFDIDPKDVFQDVDLARPYDFYTRPKDGKYDGYTNGEIKRCKKTIKPKHAIKKTHLGQMEWDKVHNIHREAEIVNTQSLFYYVHDAEYKSWEDDDYNVGKHYKFILFHTGISKVLKSFSDQIQTRRSTLLQQRDDGLNPRDTFCLPTANILTHPNTNDGNASIVYKSKVNDYPRLYSVSEFLSLCDIKK